MSSYAIAVLGPAGTYLRLVAIRLADVSVLAPYDYTRPVLNVMLAFVLFAEVPGWQSWAGAAIILLACALATDGMPARLLRRAKPGMP